MVMANMNIGKIRKVPLREVWRLEDANFTVWLEENIDHLTDVLGFNIAVESREQKVGPFSVDLYGEDDGGNKVIIENQLEKTDHAHLGQILTYLTNLEAKVAVWISSEPVEEHRKAIHWLNEVTPEDMAFYLVRLEAVKIGDDSPPAPLFTVVERPDTVIKQLGGEKKQTGRRHAKRKGFWTHFLSKMNAKSEICRNLSPPSAQWLTVTLGTTGVQMFLVLTQNHVRAEIYIDTGDKDRNKRIYDHFVAKKGQIEADFGGELIWKRLDENVASKVEDHKHEADAWNSDNWDAITEVLIDRALRMHGAFKKHIPGVRLL